MDDLCIFIYGIFLPYLGVFGDSFSTVVPINIEPNVTIKSALRYGFQKTGECLNFQKAFLCVQKCLDLNYDVAHSDKHCTCTCYNNREKAKYTLKYKATKTKWKLGAPTTSIPPWAQDAKKTEKTTKPDDIVDVSNDSNEQGPFTIDPITDANVTGTATIHNGATVNGKTALAGDTKSKGADGTTAVPGGTGGVDGTTVAGAGDGIAGGANASDATEGGATAGGAIAGGATAEIKKTTISKS